jgi:translation initiation factor IF-3
MKTLIFSDDVLTWGKTKKEIEDKLNQWNITIKGYRLKTNIDKTVSKIPDTDIRLKLDGKIVKLVTHLFI